MAENKTLNYLLLIAEKLPVIGATARYLHPSPPERCQIVSIASVGRPTSLTWIPVNLPLAGLTETKAVGTDDRTHMLEVVEAVWGGRGKTPLPKFMNSEKHKRCSLPEPAHLRPGYGEMRWTVLMLSEVANVGKRGEYVRAM